MNARFTLRVEMRSSLIAAIALHAIVAASARAVRVENLAVSFPASLNLPNPCLDRPRLTWTLPALPPASGISLIRIYRNAAKVYEVAATSTAYPASAAGEMTGPGEQHVYEVVVVNGTGIEEPDRASVTATIPPCAAPAAQLRILALLLDFSDAPAPASVDPAEVEYALFEAPISPARLFEASSYGQTVLIGDATPIIRMPLPFSSYGGITDPEMHEDALESAAFVMPNLAAYDRYLFYFSETDNNCFSYVGGTILHVNTIQGPIDALFGMACLLNADWSYDEDDAKYHTHKVAHELGHVLGMRHSGMWSCPGSSLVGPSVKQLTQGNCSEGEYGDRYGIMGSSWVDFPGNKIRDYNAFDKLLAGYIRLEQVQTVELSSLTAQGNTYWIDQLERSSSGIKLLRIHLGDGAYYLVENRHSGPNLFFAQIDRVIIRLKRSFSGIPAIRSDTVGFIRDGEQLYLDQTTQPFIDNYRRVSVSVVDTRSQSGVHQAKVQLVRIPPSGSCGLLGAEALPVLLALAAVRRRRSRDFV